MARLQILLSIYQKTGEDIKFMDAKTIKELQKTALKVRIGIIEGVHSAKSGHPGGSLLPLQALS